MSEINLDALITPSKTLILGGVSFEIEDMKIGKAFKAVEIYNKSLEIIKDGAQVLNTNDKLAKKYMAQLIDACIFIIRPEFRWGNLKKWFKYRKMNKRWVYNNVTMSQIQNFLMEILEPIIGGSVKKNLKNLVT